MSILYLLNHKTLTDFELPILISKGHSVFLPKIYNSLSSIHSINWTSTYCYDNFLFIETKDLKVLNSVDWFSNALLSDQVIKLINKYFTYIFLTLLTKGPLLTQLVNNFKGKIYYRLFGREKDLTYEPLVCKSHNIGYILSYSEIAQHEKVFFERHDTLVIPLGLSNNLIDKIEDTYRGKENRVIFICSRISKSCPYYYQIYQEFLSNFSDLNYLLLGRNNEVKSLELCDKDYYCEIANSKVMYYHGKEPRHLHYHPLEAIFVGIPIIFHKESLLSKYLLNSPGSCSSIKEAREKVISVLNDNQELIGDIVRSQNSARYQLTQMYHSNELWKF